MQVAHVVMEDFRLYFLHNRLSIQFHLQSRSMLTIIYHQNACKSNAVLLVHNNYKNRFH